MTALIVDQCGEMIEVEAIAHGETVGLSVLVSPEQWATLTAAAEELPVMLEFRRMRSVQAAREASSHHAARESRR
jgi:hypothetical protein